MTIIGIDPGTNCGWAIRYPTTGDMRSGVWDLKARRHEGGGMRYVRMRQYLIELLDLAIDQGDPASVYYEEVRRHIGTDAAHVYGGIIATIGAACEERSIPYAALPVAAIKRYATGKGNAAKADMCQAARARWTDWPASGIDVHDEADARWIAELGAHSQGLTLAPVPLAK